MTVTLERPTPSPIDHRPVPPRRQVRSGAGDGGERKALVVLLVLALLTLGVIVVVRAVEAPGRRVLLVGDSITDVSGATLTAGLGHDFDVTVSGVPGARSDERARDLAQLTAGHPDRVIINLGTNDVMQNWPLGQSMRSIETIGSSFPDACVALVTVNTTMVKVDDPSLNDRAGTFNLQVAALAARHGWSVVRWDVEVHDYIAAHEPTGPFTLDSVHPTPVGQQHLTSLYRTALDRCG